VVAANLHFRMARVAWSAETRICDFMWAWGPIDHLFVAICLARAQFFLPVLPVSQTDRPQLKCIPEAEAAEKQSRHPYPAIHSRLSAGMCSITLGDRPSFSASIRSYRPSPENPKVSTS